MTNWDKIYCELLEEILKDGVRTENRTGIDTIKIPYKTFELDTKKEFPLLTTKFVAYKWAILEMLWIYQAQSNNVNWLNDRGITIWDEWKIDEDGVYRIRDKEGKILSEKTFGKKYANTIGTAYGYVVNKFGLTQNLIKTLKENPKDRRMIMSLWQDEYLKTAVLPSCVWNSMWDVTDNKLNTIVTQRSCDVALGLPFNVAQYACLQHMIAQVTNLEVGKLYWSTKDAHLYINQLEGIKEQLRRYKEEEKLSAPTLELNKNIKDFFEFDNSKELKDVKILNYKHHGKIKMDVAV
jgi:thymidylate synthase